VSTARLIWALALIALLAAGCLPEPPLPAPVVTLPPELSHPTPQRTTPRRGTTQRPAVRTTVAIRVDRRTRDAATADFAATAMAVLTDGRGWKRAGFDFVESPRAPYRIVLAEGDEVDRLCKPYDTFGRYSCQNGPVVALNADRWRKATPSWPASLKAYRTMLINHEVGHLLHLHHPSPQCPGARLPAPVMAQQSTELDGCRPNPWPLRWEVKLAGQRREPLAPPAEHDPSSHRPSPPPARS
jgi:hypothetical protein